MLKKLIIFMLGIGLGGLAGAQTNSTVPRSEGTSTSEEKKTDTTKQLPPGEVSKIPEVSDLSLIKPQPPFMEEINAHGEETQGEDGTAEELAEQINQSQGKE
jgi:hypothetical protein